MSVFHFVRKAIRRLKADGIRPTVRTMRIRLASWYCDRRFGIKTTAFLLPEALQLECSDAHWYSPTDYWTFRRVMSRFEVGDQDVFLDYGSGMGRVVILAATYPFRRVIGVELSGRLNAIALDNVRRARRRLRCKDIEIVTADAAGYGVPDEVTFIHFYNPFGGDVLRQVVENIRRSVLRRPRKVTVLYNNPADFQKLAASCRWVAVRARVRGPQSYVIYEVLPERVGDGRPAG